MLRTRTGQSARKRELGGRRVDHATAVLRHLEELIGADHLEHLGTIARARVGGHDAVDVGVDLDLVGLERDAERASGRVTAAAAERRERARLAHALEAADDRHDAGSDRGDKRAGVDLGYRRGAVRRRRWRCRPPRR